MSFIFQNYNDVSGIALEEFGQIYDKKEDRETWYKTAIDSIKKNKEDLTYQQRVFLAAYRGFYLERVSSNSRANYLPYSSSAVGQRKFKKFVINHIHDITETKISQRARLKPAVEVLPVHDEFSDKGAAKVTKILVDNIFESNDFDRLMTELDRYSEIMGEAYMFTSFDENAGQLHPVYKKATDSGLKKVVLDDGSEVTLDKPVNVGDVKIEVEIPWRVLLQPKNKFEEVEYCFRLHLMPKQRAAKKFDIDPEDLKSMTTAESFFNPESLENELLEDHIPIYEFWHKWTEDVGNGCHAFVTADGKELMKEDLMSSDGELPVNRLTALDFPEELHGVSRYEFALPVQRMIDNYNTMIARSTYLLGPGKWLIQEGSVPKKEQLGNDNTILEFLGPIAPQQITSQPVPTEVYQHLSSLENKLQTVMGGVSDQARGMQQAQYSSKVSMQYINELEMGRSSTAIAKRARFITQMARKAIVCAKDNYQPEDERMIRLVGKNNSHLIRQFDVSVLSKPYDVKFENSSGLPELKSARYERVMEALQRNPQMYTSERWTQLLDLADADKTVSMKSRAVDAADAIVERILAGEPVSNPEEFQSHLVHWETMASLFNSISFIEEAPNDVFLTAKEHMMLREKLMIAKAKINPTFAAELSRFKDFPLFYHPEYAPPASREQQEAIVQGQANRGEAITGAIPAQPINNGLGEEDNE